MKNLFIILFLIINLQLHGQNLLLNPSFEDYNLCPTAPTLMTDNFEIIPFWSCPTKGTPDYFNKCSKGDVGVPTNFAGDSDPVSGKGYLGLLLCGSSSNKDYREYAQGKLIQPLIKGQNYLIIVNYRLANLSKYSVSQLGIYMSCDSLHINTKKELKFTPQLKLDLTISDNWVKQNGIYSAKGGEKYIIIGNFNDSINNSQTAIGEHIHNRRGKEYAYYYLDDISIEAIPNLIISSIIKDSVNNNLIDANGEVYNLSRNGKFHVSLRNTNSLYEFSIADIEISYHLTENYTLTLKCKDSSNCIKCNLSKELTVLPIMYFVFKEQKDVVQFYNIINK